MNNNIDFAPAIAACFNYDASLDRSALEDAIRKLFQSGQERSPTKQELIAYNHYLNNLTNNRKIALVYGGATKIKDYVFEAPKLPEIRGASALLDWLNEIKLPTLWSAHSSDDFVAKGIIYASGGNILAFASEKDGQNKAQSIEHLYTEYTLTANSAAVCECFSLLELRYGRNPCAYWLEDFEADWEDKHKRKALAEYYYLPTNVKESDPQGLQERFFNRKSFGELVTVLATKFNRRRDERSYGGDTRSLPFYQMLPIAQKCDGSGTRPVIVKIEVGTDNRELSEATARKLVTGRIAKGNVYRKTDLEKDINWEVPANLIANNDTFSWERRWEDYIAKKAGKSSLYAQFLLGNNIRPEMVRPARDVQEIGVASNRYIGLIYADGNNVGRLIATLQTPEIYYKVSKILSNAAETAVLSALAEYIRPLQVKPDDSNRIHLYPFEILAIGGDDLFLIVPANTVFDIAAAISTNFEIEMAKQLHDLSLGDDSRQQEQSGAPTYQQRYRPKTRRSEDICRPVIGLSAGVIVAQETAPIFFLRELVEELLKSAKKKAKESAKQGFMGGAIDFMVMKSITMVTDSIKLFRQQALGDQSLRRLTARPYSWHEFAGLLTTVRALKKAHIPRSQLYRLRRALDQEPGSAITPSVMEYLYTRTRLPPRYSSVLQEHIEQNWCWTPHAERPIGLPPWMPLGIYGWETIWHDVLEMYEMLAKEQQ